MKIISQTTDTIKRETYNLTAEDHGPVTYIEYRDSYNHIIDCNLRDENGNEIENPILLEEVQEFINSHEDSAEQQRRDEKNGLFGDKQDIAN